MRVDVVSWSSHLPPQYFRKGRSRPSPSPLDLFYLLYTLLNDTISSLMSIPFSHLCNRHLGQLIKTSASGGISSFWNSFELSHTPSFRFRIFGSGR